MQACVCAYSNTYRDSSGAQTQGSLLRPDRKEAEGRQVLEEAPQCRALQEVLQSKGTGYHSSYKGENKMLAVGAWAITQ